MVGYAKSVGYAKCIAKSISKGSGGSFFLEWQQFMPVFFSLQCWIELVGKVLMLHWQ